MNIQKFELSNGIQIILDPVESAQSVSIYVAVRTGPRYETKQTSGLAHFLEHMLLEGTEELPNSKKVAEYIENIGGKYGAYTEKDHVIYYVKMLPQHVEKGINFLHQILFHSLLSPADIEKEKNIVLEEMKKWEDNPEVEIWDVFNEWIWGKDQTLGRSSLGDKQTIQKITQETLKTYLNKHYIPANMVLSIVGKISPQSVKKTIEKLFVEENNHEIVPFEKVHMVQQRTNVKTVSYTSQQMQIVLGFLHNVTYNHPDRYALSVIATLLGGAASARLFHKIVYELGLAYFISAYNTSGIDYGIFSIYGGVSKENVKETILTILKELKKLKESQISEEELIQTKEKAKTNILFYTETPDSLAAMYASQQVTENHITSLEEIANKINKVTSKAIFDAANKYFTKDSLRLLLRGPISVDITPELHQIINSF